MTGISIGSTAITGVYVGSTLATGVYFGSTKIWPTTAGITFVAACTPASGVGDTSLNLGLPASAQAGDIVIASLMDNGSGASYTPPSGALTPVSTSFSDTAGGGGVPVQVRGYVVRLTSADISNGYLAFTLVNALATDIHGLVFRGVSDTELDVAAGVAVSTGAATTPVTFSAPGITTVTDGCMRVAVALVLPANASEDITTPAGYTVGDIGLDNGGQLQQLAYSTQPTHGATGDVSWTEGASGDTGAGWCGFLIALRPANPAITLSATFPSSLHVGDTGSFDITATRVDGATGSLTITASGLPDGMTLGATTDNGEGTFTAPVDYNLTTVEDVTSTFGATGGSVAATPLTHEFNVQASASGPNLISTTPSTPGIVTSAGIQLSCGAVKAGDQVVVVVVTTSATGITLAISDSESDTFDAQEIFTNSNQQILAVTRATISADSANFNVTIAPNANVGMGAAAYILRGKTLALDTAHVYTQQTNGKAVTVGPYSTAEPAFLAFGASAHQGSAQSFSLSEPSSYAVDLNDYETFIGHWLTTDAVTNDTQTLNATATNPLITALIAPYTWT